MVHNKKRDDIQRSGVFLRNKLVPKSKRDERQEEDEGDDEVDWSMMASPDDKSWRFTWARRATLPAFSPITLV